MNKLYRASLRGDFALVKSLTGIQNWNSGLCGACKGGHLDIVKFAILKGADDWQTAFLDACVGGNLDVVKLVIFESENTKDNQLVLDLNRGFYYACTHGSSNMQMINLLISKGANNWNYGLAGACNGVDMDLVQLMISKGANDWNLGLAEVCDGKYKSDKSDKSDRSDKSDKILQNTTGLDIVRLMISKGANNLEFAVSSARFGGNLEILKLMISGGRGNYWSSKNILECACSNGHLEIVKFFLEHYNTTNPIDMRCGAMKACGNGHLEIVQLLLPTINNWNAALGNACFSGNISIVNLVVANGANDWNKALYNACAGGHLELAKLAISKGANAWNDCFSVACGGGDIDIVQLLISYGADINVSGLGSAYESESLDIIHFLLSKGIDGISVWFQDFETHQKLIVQLLYFGIPLSTFSLVGGYEDFQALISNVTQSILGSNVMLSDLLKIVSKCIII